MKIPPLPFTVTDWSGVAPTVHPGETGEAILRTFTIGDLRVRQVEYTPGYLADYWCDLGHVLYVLEGELDTELRDGRTFKLLPGMSTKSPMMATHRIGRRPERVRNSSSSISQARLSLKEAQEPSEHLIGCLLVNIMPGRQGFAADVVGAQSPQAERVGKPLADAAGGAPQHQDRRRARSRSRPRHGSRRTNRGSSFR